MRFAGRAVACAAVVSMFTFAFQAEGDAAEFARRWAEVARRIALEHSTLGEFCKTKKMNAHAAVEFRRAVALDPNNQQAQIGLGNKLQNGAWEPASNKPAKPRDEPQDLGAALTQIRSKRKARDERAAKDLEALARFAESKILVNETKAAWIRVLTYDPKSEPANAALGRVLAGGARVHADEVEDGKQMMQCKKDSPEGNIKSEESRYERQTGWKLTKAISENFDFEGKIGEKELLELIKTAEWAHADFWRVMEMKHDPRKPRIAGVFLRTRKDFETFIDKCLDLPDRDKSAEKRAGGVWLTDRKGMVSYETEDEIQQFRDTVIHFHVSHVYLDRICFPGGAPPWMREGLAYWFSLRINKTAVQSCFSTESSTAERDHDPDGDWKIMIRAEVIECRSPALETVMKADLNNLTPDLARKGWSVVDFLLRTRKQQLHAYIKEIAKKTPPDAAVRAAFEVADYEALDEAWKSYVRERY